MLYLIANAATLPTHDYWSMLGNALTNEGNIRTFMVFNDSWHVMVLSKLLYIANYHLTGGVSWPLSLFSYSMALLTFGVYWRHIIQPLFKDQGYIKLVALFVCSLCLFSPITTHYWARSFSGPHWLSTHLLAALAFVCTVYYCEQQKGRILYIFAAFFCAILGYGSYTTSLPVLPIIIATLIYHKVSWRIVLIPFILLGFIFAHAILSPSPGEASHALDKIIPFFFNLLGAAVFSIPPYATFFGVCIFSAFAFTGIYFLWQAKKSLAPKKGPLFILLMCGSYGFTNALLIAIGRSDPDNFTAGFYEGRYLSYPLIMCLCTILFWLYIFSSRSSRNTRAIVCIAVALYIANILQGLFYYVPHVMDGQKRAEQESIAFRLGVIPRHTDSLFFVMNRFKRATLEKFKSLKQYPFNDSFDLDCHMLGRKIPHKDIRRTKDSLIRGDVHSLKHLKGQKGRRFIRFAGNVKTSKDIECILLTDNQHMVIGAAIDDHNTNWKRPHPDKRRWIGYTLKRKNNKAVKVFVKLKDDPHYYPLKKSFRKAPSLKKGS
jgi:hypothetical protein